jgi:hypothetical protein
MDDAVAAKNLFRIFKLKKLRKTGKAKKSKIFNDLLKPWQEIEGT